GWYLHTHPKLEDYRRGSVDDAQNDLEARGMKVNAVMSSIVLSAEEDRKVVEQAIDGKPIVAGTRVKRGTEVSLGYSGAMPKLKEHTISEAKNVLSQKGFPEPNVITAQSQDARTWDRVVAQEPDPDTPEKPGTGIIQLWVNVAPEPVPGGMPNLVGKSYCDAVSELSRVGLTATESLLNFSSTNPAANQTVLAQTPVPGKEIRKGADGVTLTHSGGAIRCHRQFDAILFPVNPNIFSRGQ
ncbi:MAG: PASTA domain-containing protein, partial [Nitrospirales bacterium]